MTWLRTQSAKDLRHFGTVWLHTILIHSLTFDNGVPGGQLFSSLYIADMLKLLLFTASEEDNLHLNKCRQATEAQTRVKRNKQKSANKAIQYSRHRIGKAASSWSCSHIHSVPSCNSKDNLVNILGNFQWNTINNTKHCQSRIDSVSHRVHCALHRKVNPCPKECAQLCNVQGEAPLRLHPETSSHLERGVSGPCHFSPHAAFCSHYAPRMTWVVVRLSDFSVTFEFQGGVGGSARVLYCNQLPSYQKFLCAN